MSDYSELTQDELIKEIERLKKSVKKKTFGLVWQDIPEAFDEETESKLPVLEHIPELTLGSNNPGHENILIEGDNYHALTCLNYTHKGKIDVIYIDPPYNTGNDGFVYRDKRISDKFPDGTEVPRDHPFRHSYWLSFMKKRLELAKNLLTDDGVIFISIGNDEVAQLKLLADEVFGESDFNNVIHWKKNQKPQNASSTMSESAEYILVYFNKRPLKLVRPMFGTRADERGSFKPSPLFTFDDRPRRIQIIPAGTPVEAKEWTKGKIFGVRNKLAYIELLDEPQIINGKTVNDVRVEGQWRKTESNGKYQEVVEDGRLFINSNGFPNEKAYRDENSRNVHTNLWLEAGYNELGKALLDQVLGKDNVFSYPKPVELIKEILRAVDKPNATILDFFAGSGTTGHATMLLNAEEPGSNRRWIMVTNNEGNIMHEVCYPRMKKVINGYSYEGTRKQILFEKKINLTALKNSGSLLDEAEEIKSQESKKWDTIDTKIEDGKFRVIGKKAIKEKAEGLGGSVRFYKTSFIGSNYILKADDNDAIELAKNAGQLLALAEDTLEEKEATSYYQFFEGNNKVTAVYFREELEKYTEFIDKIGQLETPTTAYVFSWGDVTYLDDFAGLTNVTVKTIPKPILEIYKSIYNLEIL